jgi:hypothetical protein
MRVQHDLVAFAKVQLATIQDGRNIVYLTNQYTNGLYQLWSGGVPSLSHILADSIYLPDATAAATRYLTDLLNDDVQDASEYISPNRCHGK